MTTLTNDQELLRLTRARYRWTQAELAARLGVSRATIGRYETGTDALDQRTRLAIEALVQREQAARRAG